MFFLFGMTQAQDLYFSGKYNGTVKIWKNNTLVHSLSDSLSINPLAIQVTPEGMVYTAGYVYDTANTQGRIWLNDSTLFSASDNSVINSLILNGEDWTAGGYGENEWNIHKGIVWRNGEVLYSYHKR